MPVPNRSTCPVCRRDSLAVDRPASRIDHEIELRDSFVERRLGYVPGGLEAIDLTRFAHGGPARLLRCPVCGTLVRDEAEQARYSSDIYDPALLRHLYPRYRAAFAQKKALYRPMLRDGAEVLEIGSHVGAFLETAEEWRWRPIGLDIGGSTSDFARRVGLCVKRLAIEDYSPRLRRPDAIFIWNCFEQMEEPGAVLRRSHEVIDRYGLLVVRVPNAEFYRERRWWLRGLAYNNLLGFPYLHGYTAAALHRLLRANGFEPIATNGSSLLTPPYPDLSARIEREWRAVRRVSGPWIEVTARAV